MVYRHQQMRYHILGNVVNVNPSNCCLTAANRATGVFRKFIAAEHDL